MSALSFQNVCKYIRDTLLQSPLKRFCISFENQTGVNMEYAVIGFCCSISILRIGEKSTR